MSHTLDGLEAFAGGAAFAVTPGGPEGFIYGVVGDQLDWSAEYLRSGIRYMTLQNNELFAVTWQSYSGLFLRTPFETVVAEPAAGRLVFDWFDLEGHHLRRSGLDEIYGFAIYVTSLPLNDDHGYLMYGFLGRDTTFLSESGTVDLPELEQYHLLRVDAQGSLLWFEPVDDTRLPKTAFVRNGELFTSVSTELPSSLPDDGLVGRNLAWQVRSDASGTMLRQEAYDMEMDMVVTPVSNRVRKDQVSTLFRKYTPDNSSSASRSWFDLGDYDGSNLQPISEDVVPQPQYAFGQKHVSWWKDDLVFQTEHTSGAVSVSVTDEKTLEGRCQFEIVFDSSVGVRTAINDDYLYVAIQTDSDGTVLGTDGQPSFEYVDTQQSDQVLVLGIPLIREALTPGTTP